MEMLEHKTDTKSGELVLSVKLIEDFLAELKLRGRGENTLSIYRRKLNQLYDMLPEDKAIRSGTLEELRQTLKTQDWANNSINVLISSANGLLGYCNRRELQLGQSLEKPTVIQPELTRTEYLRLLSTARQLNKERAYLLIKIFASTGLYVREIPYVTVESIKNGMLTVPSRGIVHIPACICRELQDYAFREGVVSGPVFTTAEGKPVDRSAINALITRVSNDAKVAPEKCNPMALRRLYLATQESILSSLSLLIEQTHDRMLENEQLTIGWDQREAHGTW